MTAAPVLPLDSVPGKATLVELVGADVGVGAGVGIMVGAAVAGWFSMNQLSSGACVGAGAASLPAEGASSEYRRI